MGLSFLNTALPETFEPEFQREVLLSERFRLAAFAAVLGVLLFDGTILLLLFPGIVDESFDSTEPLYWALALCIAYIIRSLTMRYIAGRLLKTGKSFPAMVRYGNAFAEITFPTLGIIAFSTGVDPLVAITSPVMLFYFVFILLSTLELDPKLSLFIAVIAAVQYFTLAEFFFAEDLAPANAQYIGFKWLHFGKAMLLIITGVCAAFVASQIRRRIIRSFQVIEERNNIQKAFGQQVSSKIVDELMRTKTEIESRTCFVCIMFLDIKDFTPFSESRSPEEIVRYQNDVFSFMIEIINRREGIINQFMGDGFMATFGAPITSEDDCKNAVEAALEIAEEVEARSESGALYPTKIRIGLHAGEVVTGNVGTSIRKQYSITGNPVILASRLEQLNKSYASTILSSKEVLDRVPPNGLVPEPLGPVDIKGRSKAIEVFKLK
jgi:adenylate cyclase